MQTVEASQGRLYSQPAQSNQVVPEVCLQLIGGQSLSTAQQLNTDNFIP